MATHSSFLAWRTPWTEEPAGCSPWGHRESHTTEAAGTHTWEALVWPPRAMSLILGAYFQRTRMLFHGTILSFRKFNIALIPIFQFSQLTQKCPLVRFIPLNGIQSSVMQ